MKILKLISSSFFAIILFCTQTQISSCKKETITIIVKDTIRIVDSSTCYNLTDGLIAYYNFKNGSINDLSGNNNNISFNNAVVTTDRFGKANNAYLFNGSSSYMKVSSSASLNPSKISIMAIIKPNAFYLGNCNANNILCKGTNNNPAGVYGLQFFSASPCNVSADTTKEYFGGFFGDTSPGPASAAIADSAFIHTGQWYNVIYTYDGATSNLYINGSLKKSQIKIAPSSGNAQDILIGKYDNPQFPYWFTGVIDEIRIYNRALCDCEVKSLNKLKE
jgi:hypothetical protein